MVGLALVGVLSLSSPNPQGSGIAAAPLVTSVSTAPLVQNSIKSRRTLQVGPSLSVSDATIVANQDLTISGSGFSEAIGGEAFCIVEGNIILNNVALEFDDDSDCPQSELDDAGASEGILLTSGGTFTLTVRVHDVVGTVPALNTALLAEGTHELKVIDTNGAEGTIQLTIPERTLEVSPAASRPGDVVSITGRNFIGSNPDGLSATIEVKYQCGANSTSVTANPDVSGDFQEAITIPSNCSIPSTNTITAAIEVAGENTNVVEVVVHEIPEATCSPPGSGVLTVAVNCTFQGSAAAPGNVIVEPGIALTIDTGAALDINFTNFHLLIRSGAKVVIKDGGKIH